jgi:glycosyltransferase involved in cell wall biosynthesis
MQHYGVSTKLHSMRAPHQNFFGSEWADRMNRETNLLYPIDPGELLVSLITAPFRFRRRFFAAVCNSLFSQRESARARMACIAHLGVACVWARQLAKSGDEISLIHSQWIQSGGTIGWYAAWLLGVPFSFTGHAVDLFRDRSALADKIAAADFIVAISQFHKDFYVAEGARPEDIHIVYCGIDLGDYPYRFRALPTVPRILSFGRLVEKKGFDTLIDACAELKARGRAFECVIAGNGPEEAALRELIVRLGVDDVVKLTGQPLLQEEIPAWLDAGHLFAQPCRWSKDNDVDGIPRSLMEGMAVGLPSVSTRVAGIPDLVIDQESGLLVEPADAPALADALERLLLDPALCERLAAGGRRMVEERFNLDTCLEPLASLFRSKVEHCPAPAADLTPKTV